MPPARQQQSIAPCSEPERWGLPNHTLPALVASLTGSRPESAKSSPESPVVAPGKSGGHAGNLGYFRGNFGSCGRVGGRSPGHFRHLLCSFRALCLVAGVAVIDHGPSGLDCTANYRRQSRESLHAPSVSLPPGFRCSELAQDRSRVHCRG